MGICCGRRTTRIRSSSILSSNEQLKLPKLIVTPQRSTILFYEKYQTYSSYRLKSSLKNHFPILLTIDREQRLVKFIENIQQNIIYLILTDEIYQETMKYLIKNTKIKAIYFALVQINFNDYPQSNKIKGFYSDSFSLKKSIFIQLRLDEGYSDVTSNLN